jgi:hypothetical protein
MPRKVRSPVQISDQQVTLRIKGVKYRRWLVWTTALFGRPKKTRYKKTYEEAEKARDELLVEYKQRVQGFDLSDRAKVLDAAEAFRRLEGRTSLTAAAQFWVDHHQKAVDSVLFPAAVEDYLLEKGRHGMRETSLGPLRFVLRRVATGFVDQKVSILTPATLQAWFGAPTTTKKKKPKKPNLFRSIIGAITCET